MDNLRNGSAAESPRLLGYAEAAEILGVSKYTLRRWACQGRIGFTRVGSKIVRFRPQQLQAFLAAGTVEPRVS
jgi:excisionase family DNA binding protein